MLIWFFTSVVLWNKWRHYNREKRRDFSLDCNHIINMQLCLWWCCCINRLLTTHVLPLVIFLSCIKTGVTDCFTVLQGGISNILEELVVQPLLVSISALTLSTETVRSILKIDDVVRLNITNWGFNKVNLFSSALSLYSSCVPCLVWSETLSFFTGEHPIKSWVCPVSSVH